MLLTFCVVGVSQMLAFADSMQMISSEEAKSSRCELKECMRNAVHSYETKHPNEVLTKEKQNSIVWSDNGVLNALREYWSKTSKTVLSKVFLHFFYTSLGFFCR